MSTDSKPPKLPQNAAACSITKPGYKFLQAICEKPEFVCTCCHRWLFCKSCLHFNMERYDFENLMVSEALSDVCRHKMDVFIIEGS